MEFVEKFSEAVEEDIRKDPSSGRNGSGSGKWAQDLFLPSFPAMTLKNQVEWCSISSPTLKSEQS